VNQYKKCYANSSRPDYCGPSAFKSQKDRLFHNRGDGTFEDVTDKVLIDYQSGSGLGVITIDVNSDGWMDFYVANDGQANQLWINQEGKTFIDDALFSGAAINQNGQAEASMGVGAGDFDGDGDEDLIMTHIMGETNTLFVNDGSGLFEDKTISMGLSSQSFPYTSPVEEAVVFLLFSVLPLYQGGQIFFLSLLSANPTICFDFRYRF